MIFEARDELNDSSWSVRRGSNENYLWLQSYDKNGIFIALHFYIFNILLHRNVLKVYRDGFYVGIICL